MICADIVKVKATSNIDEVNQLLAAGWIILNIFNPDGGAPTFVLGLRERPNRNHQAPHRP